MKITVICFVNLFIFFGVLFGQDKMADSPEIIETHEENGTEGKSEGGKDNESDVSRESVPSADNSPPVFGLFLEVGASPLGFPCFYNLMGYAHQVSPHASPWFQGGGVDVHLRAAFFDFCGVSLSWNWDLLENIYQTGDGIEFDYLLSNHVFSCGPVDESGEDMGNIPGLA